VPPFALPQDQLQGPLPETAEAVPALQSSVVGAVLVKAPFIEPHWPLAKVAGAEQLAVVPSPAPAQVQSHGPVPVSVEAVPALHRLALGAIPAATPLAEPHAPLTAAIVKDAVAPVW